MNETQTEGNQKAPGGEDANSQPLETQGQPLDDSLALVKGLQDTVKSLQGEINALKSGKDKAVDRVEKATTQQLQVIEQLAGYLNIEPAKVREAQRAQVLDQLVNERMTQPAPPTPGKVESEGTKAGQYSASEAIAEVEKYNLPSNDPDFIALLRKNPNAQQVKDYVLGKLTPQREPEPGNVVGSPLLGKATGDKTPAQLEKDYQADMAAIAAAYLGNEKIRKIAETKEKYRGMGLAKY